MRRIMISVVAASVALVGCGGDGAGSEAEEPEAAASEPDDAEAEDETEPETETEAAEDETDAEAVESRPVATEPVVGACIEDFSVMEVGDHEDHTPDAFVYVDCAGVHHAEILGVLEFEGEEYPGVDAMGQQLGPFCEEAGESYLYDQDVVYDGRAYLPTEPQWQDGHRAGLCFVLPPTGVENFEGPVGG